MDRKNNDEALVSIIVPTYNCEDFVGKTLQSILEQTYQNWEAILVDDCSTDNTLTIVKKYAEEDSRIKYYSLSVNSGAAIVRNKAVDLANGEYIAFLDSDDIWFPEKLEKQIKFMKENYYTFTCTSYIKIDADGRDLNIIIDAQDKVDYEGLLRRNVAGNSTVIYNAKELGKFKIPNIRKRNDYVMWLQVIKSAGNIYGIKEPLAGYRIRPGSLSRNKISLVKYNWRVYREIEKLSLVKSCYLIVHLVMVTILKMFKLR